MEKDPDRVAPLDDLPNERLSFPLDGDLDRVHRTEPLENPPSTNLADFAHDSHYTRRT